MECFEWQAIYVVAHGGQSEEFDVYDKQHFSVNMEEMFFSQPTLF